MVYRILGRLIITDSLLQIFLIVFLSTMFTIRDRSKTVFTKLLEGGKFENPAYELWKILS